MREGCGCKKPDRYESFRNIDCDGKARRVMACIDRQLALPERTNAFWEYFARKRAGHGGRKPDDLFLIHSHVNEIRELFETWDDADALALLEQLEDECC